MAKFRVETIEGGITQIVIEGKIEEKEHDLFQSLSHLSKSKPHILVNLSQAVSGTADFYEHLNQLSARTKIKIIAKEKTIIERCVNIGLTVFPTMKSAALAFAGDETMKLLKSKLRDVPILNTDAYELVAYISRPDMDFGKLELMIKDKPSLCSQIFRMANSTYFRRANKSETLTQALLALGITNLRQIFLYNFYSSVGNVFKAHQEVILHGRQCALLSEYICRAAGGDSEECAKVRMGGLLHDIGQQALAFFFPKQYEKVTEVIAKEKRPSYVAELLVFGMDHQKIGSVLAKLWNFPPYLENLIGDHHYLALPQWNVMTLPIFCANNFLNEKSGRPVSPYYQKLEGYFMLKRKDLPWKDVNAEFNQFLSTQEDVF